MFNKSKQITKLICLIKLKHNSGFFYQIRINKVLVRYVQIKYSKNITIDRIFVSFVS